MSWHVDVDVVRGAAASIEAPSNAVALLAVAWADADADAGVARADGAAPVRHNAQTDRDEEVEPWDGQLLDYRRMD